MVPCRSPAVTTSLRLASAANTPDWACVVGVDEVAVVRVDAAVVAGPPAPQGESPSRSHHSATTSNTTSPTPATAASGFGSVDARPSAPPERQSRLSGPSPDWS